MKRWMLTRSTGSPWFEPLDCDATRGWPPRPGEPGVCEVRLGPFAGEREVRIAAWQCRALLAKGRTVRLRQMVRRRSHDLEGLFGRAQARWEQVAAALHPIAWRSRGPSLGARSIDVYLIPGRG